MGVLDYAAGVPSSWLLAAATLTVSYVVANAVYLVYFHPAASIPGPKSASASYLVFCYQWIRGRFPWYVEDLLHRYGDAVRVGPNDVAFFTPQAAMDIYGSAVKNQETFRKTDLMDYGLGDLGFIWETDPAKRKQSGKKILPAFSNKANKSKENLMHMYMDLFMTRMRDLGNTAEGLKMNDWVLWLGVDLGADLAYGRELHHMRDGKSSDFVDMLRGTSFPGTLFQLNKKVPGIALLAPLFIPFRVLRAIPRTLKSNEAAVKWRIDNRASTKHPDYMDYMISPDDPPPATKKELLHIEQVAFQMFISGFDPIQILFYSVMYFLVKYPDVTDTLSAEIRGAFKTYEEVTPDSLAGLPYLHAFLYEVLRGHLITGSGMPRVSPGATVDGVYVPKGVTCYLSSLTAMRHERYFHEPKEFRPQRWLPQNHPLFEAKFAHDNLKAFFPFSIGPRQCTGREIAVAQTKLFVGKLLWNFDVEGVRGHEGSFDDFTCHVMWNRPDLFVRFRPVER